MNVSDTEVVWAILQKNGYVKTDNVKEVNVALLLNYIQCVHNVLLSMLGLVGIKSIQKPSSYSL